MKRFSIFILIIVGFISCKKEVDKVVELPQKTVLKGCIVGRDSDTLLLVKSHEDARHDTIASIPITNWEFVYELEYDTIERYSLVFKDELNKGAWRPVDFFPEADTIDFRLHTADKFDMNKIEGGQVNATYLDYNRSVVKPYNSKLEKVYSVFDSVPYSKMQSEAYTLIIEKLQAAETQEEKVPLYKAMSDLEKNGLDKNAFGKEIDKKVSKLQNTFWDNKYQYIMDNPTILSYSLLIEDIQSLSYNPAPKEKLILALNDLKQAFPNHPYSTLAENLWIGYTEMKPGGQYINFTAPDIDNVSHELKTVVEANEVVLLDLWATWCGPCIARSRLMKPVYETYKNKGFDILGVAGEKKNLEAYKKFMAKEQWPWKNLIELDNENKIWEQYNIMNGGGGMFLISKSGKILAVDPSADEVEAILKERLESYAIKS